MTNVKNELPIAVHIASGGDARLRSGGASVDLNGETDGSFQVTGATRYKICANLRSNSSTLICVGYQSPVTMANASMLLSDMGSVVDDVPDGTTVYFGLFDVSTMDAAAGGASDTLLVSFYS